MDKEDTEPYNTLVREVFEEANFDVIPYKEQLNHLGKFQYLSWKQLDLYYL